MTPTDREDAQEIEKTPPWIVKAPSTPQEQQPGEKSQPPTISHPTPPQTTQQAAPPPTPPLTSSDYPILRMRQPFKILTDIWGVLTPYTFRATLFHYIDDHLGEYLRVNATKSEVKSWLAEIRVRTQGERAEKYPDMPEITEMTPKNEMAPENETSKEAAMEAFISSVVANVKYRQGKKSPDEANLMSGLEYILSHVWTDGYRRRQLQPPIFPDVLPAFTRWSGPPFQVKLYTFASGPWDNQKVFLSAALEGPKLVETLTCGFDAFGVYKYQAMRYRQVVAALTERVARNLFYLTDSPRKAAEARKAGLSVFIVRRPGNRVYRAEQLRGFTVLDSLEQFDFYEFQ